MFTTMNIEIFMKKTFLKIFILVLSGLLLVFCFGINGFAAEKAKNSISIRDFSGKMIKVNIPLKLPVKRMVILTSDALEVVRILNAGGLVVGGMSGLEKVPLFWPKLKDLPKIGTWNEPNYELIAGLNPDLVIGYAGRPGPEMEKKLSPFGITVMRLNFYKINTLLEEVAILGRILNREKEAREFADWYQQKMQLIQEGIRTLDSLPNVYIESYTDYHSAGRGSGGNEMCVWAGGYNISGESAIQYPEVTSEWVVAKNPDIIIKAASQGRCYQMTEPGRLKNIRTGIIQRPAWNNISAVKKGKVYVIASDIWTGPMAIVGISYMAKWFHPAVFKDIDPVLIHKEYLEKFQKIKYSGVYVYP